MVQEGTKRFGRAALRIASWTLLSRLLGLVRDRLMFGLFGRGAELGAFHLAWTLPNTFRRLLGEGALTAAFVPVLTRRLDTEGLAGARRTFAAVLGALLLLLVGLLAVLWGIAGVLPEAWLARGGPDYAVILRQLLFVLLPYVLPVCLLTLAAAAQNVTGRFALPAAAPALLNVVWIAAVLVAGTLDVSSDRRVLIVGVCLLAGGWLQLLLQMPGLAKSGLLARPRLALGDSDLRSVAKSMLPVVLGLSVVQLNTFATQVIAAFLVDSGAPSVLFLANRMLEFPHALLGVALGTAVFPLLSLHGGRGDSVELRRTLDRALALGVFLAVPAAAGLLALAPWLIDVLFVSGRFTSAAGLETTRALQVLCLAVPGLIGVQILARTFYAVGDMRTPVRVAVAVFVIAQGLNVALAPGYGTAGLAVSSAVAATANAALLAVALRRHELPPGAGRVFGTLVRALVAAVPTALVAWLAADRLDPLVGESGLLVRIAVVLLVPGALGALVFFAVARLVGAGEVATVLDALRRRSDSGNGRPRG